MRICKIFQWDAAHQLKLPYESACRNIHGHTYKVEVELEGDLNENGMVMDFVELKKRVNKCSFDHYPGMINAWMDDIQPTAENMVNMLKCKLIEQWQPGDPTIRRIRIWETPTSWAEQIWDVKNEKIRTSLAESVKHLQKINKHLEEKK